jgi:hypothetical protein
MQSSNLSQSFYDSGRISFAPLTKKLLFSLAEGTHVISGILTPDCKPAFSCRIYGNREHREAIWASARTSGSKNRNCAICKDGEALAFHLSQRATAFAHTYAK